MLEARSPLASISEVSINGIMLSEVPDFTLTQVAGDDKALKKVLGKLPLTVGTAIDHDGRTMLRTASKQIWVLGEAPQTGLGIYLTPLSSARTRFLLKGHRSREVLSACALIDFHFDQFKTGQFVLTGIHHTRVLIYCLTKDSFHIYVLRTFALNVWEWLADVIEGLAHD
jgi:methylglutamate dehydrogenase subunit D